MRIFLLCLTLFACSFLHAQNEEALLQKVRAKLDKVSDYEATGKLKLDVSFIKAPDSDVQVYYKKPNKFKVKKAGGISILPKGGVSVNTATLLPSGDFQAVSAGTATVDGVVTTVLKLIPTDDAGDVVLSTLYIDEKQSIIRKAVVATKESGSYEVGMTYGKYIAWGLPDKVVFSFNAKDYKLPKGITFEYEKGGAKKPEAAAKNQKGSVTITYASYKINKGVDEKVFL